jgi:hypothetical protein
MSTKVYQLDIRFTTELLGSQPQRDIAVEYLSKALIESGEGDTLPADEVATLDELLKRGTTAFHKLDGQPVLWDYQVKGFLREAARIFNGSKEIGGIKALRSKVGNLVFVTPRMIPLILPADGKIEYLERPLRAETPQGPRETIARSEILPVGTALHCELEVFGDVIDRDVLTYLLDYGRYQGLGQWRNGGWGRFEFELSR